MIDKILYVMMLVGFTGLSLRVPSLKMKIIGLLLAVVNALLFWK